MRQIKLSYNAIHTLYEAADGRNRAFHMVEQPYGWNELTHHGLCVRDGVKAIITPAGHDYLRANPRVKISGVWSVL
jgi:hypothetical protein